MKKKLAALLSACLVLSAAFYSCGNDDDDDDSSRRKSSSGISSEETDPKYDQNDDDEEETTTEVTTTAVTTTEAVTTVTTTASSSGSNSGSSGGNSSSSSNLPLIPASEAPEPAGGDVKGIWGGFEGSNNVEGMLEFGDNGVGAMYADISSTMHFNSDGSLTMESLKMNKDSVSFDGKTIRVKMDAASMGIDPSSLEGENAELFTQDILVLERIGAADSSSMDGEYKFNGGIMGDALSSEFAQEYDSFSSDNLIVVIKGTSLLMKIDNIFTYTISGKTISMKSDNEMFTDSFEQADVEYTVDGDTLYMYNAENDGQVLRLTRASF